MATAPVDRKKMIAHISPSFEAMLYTIVPDDVRRNIFEYSKDGGDCYDLDSFPYFVKTLDAKVYEVTIPTNAHTIISRYSVHTDRFTLSNPMSMENFLRIYSLWPAVLEYNGQLLEIYPNIHTISDNLLEIAVQSSGLAIQYIPFKKQTQSLCELAVQQNGMAIQYIPKKKQTIHICELAVRQNGMAIQYIQQTTYLSWIAIEQIPDAIEFVKHPTYSQHVHAISKRGYLLRHVHPTLQTEEMCLDAVSQFGFALRYVHKQTPEICKKAISTCGCALEDVHEQTEEIVQHAIQCSPYNLQYVRSKTPEHCLDALKGSGFALHFVPPEMIVDICNLIRKKNVQCIYFDASSDARYIEERKRGCWIGFGICLVAVVLYLLLPRMIEFH